MAAAAQQSSLESDLAEVLADFPSFCSLLEIRTKRQGIVNLHYSRWHPEQRTFEANRTGLDLVLKPRQIGFSTLELARDLHHAITHPGENVQVVVHDAEIKEQLFLTLRTMADGLHRVGLLPRTLYSTKTELVFRDIDSAVRIVEAGATVQAAKKKGRSGTIHRLHATEIAFWGQPQETWAALGSSVPDDAEIVIESTANGAGGLFYELVQYAHAGKGKYRLHFFPWYLHYSKPINRHESFDSAPRDKWEEKFRKLGLKDQHIAWWRNKVDSPEFGLDKTLQEYPVDVHSAFRMHGRAYFEADLIDELSANDVRPPIFSDDVVWAGRSLGKLLVYEHARAGRDYVVGADVSEGTGLDAHAAAVLDRRSGRKVASFSSDAIEPGDFGLALAFIGRSFNTALLAPERNNHGHAAIRALVHEAKYPVGRIYQASDEKLGWTTNQATRSVLIDDLGAAIRTHVTTTPDAETLSECKTLVRNDKGKVEARDKGKKDGSKDDRFIAWAIAWQARNAPGQEIKPVHIPGF